MSEDVTSVGIKIETSDISRGIKSLEALSRQGPLVERAMDGISNGSKRVAKSLADLGIGADAVRKVGTASREMVSDTESLRRALAGLTAEEERFVRSLEKQYNAMNMGRGDYEAYVAAQRGMGTGAQEVARALGNKIEALKKEQAELAGSNDLMKQATSLAKGLFAGVTFSAFASKLVSVQREFDKLNSSLITVTGSSINAAAQMAWIKDFAKETPFGLAQATGAFVKMKALGLDPTRQALTSFGNTASAMGKDLNQMIEAVADASTGEFERLKEFGIKASKDGEQIKLTFQGVTTTVRNSAEEITKYLENIGNNQFAGAMEQRAKTLDGAISELSDTWDELFRTVNQQNTGQFIYESVRLASGAIDDLTTIIRAANQAMGDGAQAGRGFSEVQNAIATVFETVVALGLNVKYVLTQVGNEIGGLAAQAAAIARGDFAGAAAIREAMVSDAKAARAAVDQQTENVLKARQNAKEIADYRNQIAKSDLGGIAAQVDGFKPQDKADISLLGRADSLLKSTSGLKSQAEAMAEVKKQGAALTAVLKDLRDAGKGDSEQAKELEARLAGVNEKLESMAKKGSSRGADTQAKAVSDIRARILAEEDLIERIKAHGTAAIDMSEADKLVYKLTKEMEGATNARTKASLAAQLAEAKQWQEVQNGRIALEKQVKVQDEAEKSFRKYLDSLYKSADAMGDMADKQDAANATFGKSKVAIAEMAMEQAKLAAANAKNAGPWTPEQIAALEKLASEHERYVKSLKEGAYIEAKRKYEDEYKSAKAELELQQYSMSLLGVEETKRQQLLAIRKSELAYEKEIAQIRKNSYSSDPIENEILKADLIAKARINAEINLQTELSRIQDQFATEQANKYGDIFRQGFADFVNNGTEGLKAFGKSLKTTVLTSVADALYKAFAQKFVMNVAANISGGGWLDSILGLVGMAGGGGSGGGSNIFGLASNANTAYNMYTGQGWTGQAWNYASGLWGGSAPWSAAGVQASGAVTTPVTGGLGAAAPGSSMWSAGGMGWAGVAVAIPLIAAYLGGMFKDEKMVGTGITGDLGGDLYGYQLMRESGGLFDGPDYRYVIAEKEIKETKAQIEALKTNNPYAAYGERGNARRDEELQQLYNKLDVLERNYGAAIDGSKGPIKILQDAFTAMRDDTAKRADILGLDGDAIRNMKVALGLDEIHPDTGGKGLELTGLTQEEAQKKIQDALNQANEELAKSVLGSWEEQTREVSRMVWETVQINDGGDTDRYQRIGKEVTDTISEQVWVMSEYVRTGETAIQALTRLSDSLVSVNSVFDMLGLTLMDTSLAGADMASEIVDAFGGGDKFAAATSNYYDKFYSDQEKVANQTRLLDEQLKKLGIDTMPASREAFRDYIAGIDKSTEEGQKLFATLIGLADVFDLVYQSAENIASLKEDLNLQLLRAQGNDAEATRLEREKQIKELEKYKDPELVKLQRDVWAAEDKKKADDEAGQALESAKSAALTNLQDAISREKEYWNQFSADAKDALSKASSYWTLVTDAAKSLRGSTEDISSWNAAQGKVFIEQAVANARKGLGLSDYDATKSAIDSATAGLSIDKYATQAELDYDKKVLAGQLSELGDFAGLAKSDAQKQIDLATDQIKRLDDTLKFWQDYGKEQVNATLSVTEAVNALYKLLDPKEQERIRREEAEKAGLTGGTSTPPTTYTGGGTLGGTVTGSSNRVTVVGLTADGRAIYSDGTTGKTAAGEYTYNDTGSMNSNGYSLAEFERFKASGEFEWDPAKNQWVRRASFAVGTNYVPYDMTANIHQGERIIPAADNRALMAAVQSGGSGNGELLNAVNRLEQRLAAIEDNTGASRDDTRKIRADIGQVTNNGTVVDVNVTNRAIPVRTS